MKDLKTEYKRACEEETPDLWNRISDNLVPRPESKNNKRKKKWSLQIPAVIAAALLLLVFPAVYLNQKNIKNYDRGIALSEADEDMVSEKNFGVEEMGQNSAVAEFIPQADSCEAADCDTDSMQTSGTFSMCLTVNSIVAYEEGYMLTAQDDEGRAYTISLCEDVENSLSFALKEGDTYEMTLQADDDRKEVQYQVTEIKPVTEK